MLNIESLPNTITDYDRELFEKNSKKLSFMGNAYSPEQIVFELETYNESTDKFSGTAKVFNMTSFEDVPVDDIPRTLEAILPSNYDIFKSYKKEMKIVQILIDGELNIGDEMISHLVDSSYEDAEQAKLGLASYEYIIYNPSSLSYIYYSPQKEHVFTSSVTSEEFECDSLDLALKASYEWSKTECDYSPPETRKRLSKLDEWFESEEGKRSIEEFAEELAAKDKRYVDFFESEEFSKLEKEIIPNLIKENDIGGFHSENYMYGEGNDELLDEKTFYKFTSAAFHCLDLIEDESAMFSTQYVELTHLKLSMTHGQGTVYSIVLKD